jgi:hypothetical protein
MLNRIVRRRPIAALGWAMRPQVKERQEIGFAFFCCRKGNHRAGIAAVVITQQLKTLVELEPANPCTHPPALPGALNNPESRKSIGVFTLIGRSGRQHFEPFKTFQDPVVSRNSNEAIGECASRLLDDPRRLVSPYTPLQCPHRFSLFSCCS